MEIIKHNLKFIIPIVALFIGAIILVYNSVYNVGDEVIVKEETKTSNKKEKSENKKFYYVDIKGSVNNPGVYKMDENSRVIDVIESAGGLKDDADTSIINLGKKVFDEMFIIVYSKEEVEKYKNDTLSTEEINKKIEESVVIIDPNNDAQIKVDKQVDNKEESNKININTANKDELQKITGIGESKAKAIIKYREENGNFENIEDIKNVSGIGDSLFEKIKDNITI